MRRTVHFTKMQGSRQRLHIRQHTALRHSRSRESRHRLECLPYRNRQRRTGSHRQAPRRQTADYSMRIFNADGSEAMMCGNASRCIGKYLYEKGLTHKDTIRLETLSGVKILKLHIQDGTEVESVTVDMLKPLLQNREQFVGPSVLAADERIFEGTYVCMGNPHFVTFVDDIDTIDIAHYGRLLEYNEAFPQRCNIEFAQLTDADTIRTRYGNGAAASRWLAEQAPAPRLWQPSSQDVPAGRATL